MKISKQFFEKIGLSNSEIEVYLATLKQGNSRAGMLIKKTGLQSSAVYSALNKLIEKGLIKFHFEGKIKIYSAADPKTFREIIDDINSEYDEVLPKLSDLKRESSNFHQADVYHGLKSVKIAHLDLIKNAKRGEKYRFFSIANEFDDKNISNFFERFDLIREEKGIIVQGLTKISKKNMFKTDMKIHNKLTVRGTKHEIISGSGIFQDKVLIVNWGEVPVAFILTSQSLADSYKKVFDELWEKAK